MKYTGSYIITYKLRAITGLRVGGSKEEFDIGGTDNPVLKVPVEIPEYYEDGSSIPQGAPYIPGSSVKGKMRSLLEWVYGRVEENVNSEKARELKNKVDQAYNQYLSIPKEDKETRDKAYRKFTDALNEYIKEAGKVCSCGVCEICIVFGVGDADTYRRLLPDKQPGPPRAKFFDLYPTKETLKRLQEALGTGIFTEIKTENQINRITSRANPRKVERVPAGAEFEGRIVFDCYREGDNELLRLVFEGMQKLEDSFLGGYGSRGSGRVQFRDIEVLWRPAEYYRGDRSMEEQKGRYDNLQKLLNNLEAIISNGT